MVGHLLSRTQTQQVSGGIKVLEITPARSEPESLEGRKLLCQTRDLTRAMTGRGMISRASSNPELSISLSENYFCGGHPVKPRMKRSASLDIICGTMSPWNEEYAYQEYKRLHEQARRNVEQEREQNLIISVEKEKIIDTSVMKEQNTATPVTPEQVLTKRFSSIIIGQDASPRTLNSPATPLPRSSVKRALVISPGMEMSPARRYSFSNRSDASPVLRKSTGCFPKEEKLPIGNGDGKNWLLTRTRSQQRDRSYTTGDMRVDSKREKTSTWRRSKAKAKKMKTVVDITQPKIYEVGRKVPGDVDDKRCNRKCVEAESSIHTTVNECQK